MVFVSQSQQNSFPKSVVIIEFEGCAIKSISAHISQKVICAIHSRITVEGKASRGLTGLRR
jgi:hypothetical protein